MFCFDDEFFGRRRPAPFCQQTNLVKFSSPKLKLVLQLPAKNFKEIVKINCDNHKILDNFCQIKNYSEECPRHHNVCIPIIFFYQHGKPALKFSTFLEKTRRWWSIQFIKPRKSKELSVRAMRITASVYFWPVARSAPLILLVVVADTNATEAAASGQLVSSQSSPVYRLASRCGL